MEVILLQDVKGLGKKGDTKTVADGYGNNYLIRNNIAVKKTVEAVKNLEKENEKERLHQEDLKKEALETKGKLGSIILEFTAKAGKDGTMIGQISTKEVCEKLVKDYNINIDKRKFVDKILVNAFGTSILKNELYKGIIADVKVHVSEEK
ncbi:MAG: 50S ribosomal protein L9 [Bacilli bacterium]